MATDLPDFATPIARLQAELERWSAGAQVRPLDDILTDGYSLVLAMEGERLHIHARVETLAVRDPLDAATERELTRLVRREVQISRQEVDLRESLSAARAERRRHAAA